MKQSPPQPKYILRGHNAHITALRFSRSNTRLLTADTDGWLIVWSLSTKRPVAVWKAHEQTVLGIEDWNEDFYLTHGREQKVIAWHLPVRAENGFSTTLPGETATEHVKQPWILHSLRVRGSGFCPFAVCSGLSQDGEVNDNKLSLLIAAPGGDNVVDIIALPSEKTLHNVHAPRKVKTGMIMTLKLRQKDNSLFLCTGYESGHTIVQILETEKNEWNTIHVAQSHCQPVLSVDTSPNLHTYYSCAADSVIAEYPLSSGEKEESSPYDVETCIRKVTTGHTGQQQIRVRSDGQILATAGWDGRIRIYSTKSLKELAVLIWHKQGCYTVDFATVLCNAVADKQGSLDADNNSQVHHTQLTRLNNRREMQAQSIHWIAAGSKDGKVSLWDIY